MKVLVFKPLKRSVYKASPLLELGVDIDLFEENEVVEPFYEEIANIDIDFDLSEGSNVVIHGKIECVDKIYRDITQNVVRVCLKEPSKVIEDERTEKTKASITSRLELVKKKTEERNKEYEEIMKKTDIIAKKKWWDIF